MTGTEGQCATKAWYHCVLMALLALLILLFMAVMPKRAFAAEVKSVTYIDEQGNERTEDCFIARSKSDLRYYNREEFWDAIAFADEWEADSIELLEQTRLLVLMDGCKVSTNTVTIHGADYRNDFKIFGQKEDTGTLEVTKEGADEDSIAFNAFYDNVSTKPELTLYLYGGNISVTTDGGCAVRVFRDSDSAGGLLLGGGTLTVSSGGSYGAEISSNLTISGGTFEAAGVEAGIVARGGADISGGVTNATATSSTGVGLLSRGDLLIEDGTVNATGPGGGILMDDNGGGSESITITGGNVTGTCTGVGDQSAHDGPGIGASNPDGCDLLIKGGTVIGTSVNGAGIGGSEGSSAPVSIRIEKGDVTGTSSSGAGIGTGRGVQGGDSSVTIAGGTVTATSRSGAGIGGGENSSGCSVTIKGGTVTKSESMTGAGIGGGFGGDGGTVNITGGTVNAYASEDSSGFQSAGAAIGGGSSCTGYSVNISGSDTMVTATAESGAGIGCGENGASGSVTIEGGTVYATSNGTGACIGSAYNGGDCTVNISGGKVYAGLYDGGGQTDGAGIGGGEDGSGGAITISGGEVYARSAYGGAGIGGGYGASGGTVNLVGGKVVAWSQQDGDGQAIGHGEDGSGDGTLALGYDAEVIAGTSESDAQYATVSAKDDGRFDACRQLWAQIQPCDHEGADTFYEMDWDRFVFEIHCARCNALLGEEVHDFVAEAIPNDHGSALVYCTDARCRYNKINGSIVTVAADNAIYDAQEHGAHIEITGSVPQEVFDVFPGDGMSGGEDAPIDAGNYTATAAVIAMGTGGSVSLNKTFSIDPRPVLVCPYNQTVLYGHAIRQSVSQAKLRPALGVDKSGLVAGHALSAITLSPDDPLYESCAIEASGVQITDSNDKDVTANYDLRYQQGKATVINVMPVYTPPQPLLGLIYDGTNHALVKPGSSEEMTFEYALAKEGPYGSEVPTAKDAGAYTVWWRMIHKGSSPDAIPEQPISVTIAPRRADLAWSDTSFTYDGAYHAPVCSVANLVAGDSCKVTVAGKQRDAGSYTASATALSNGNYVLQSESTLTCVFDIARREVVVSGIGAKDKVYDATAEARLDYENVSFDGMVKGDVLTVSAKGAFESADAGERTVSLSDLVLGGDDAHNYVLASSGQQSTATAKITKRPVAVQALDQAIINTGSIDESAVRLASREGYPLIEEHELADVELSTTWPGPEVTSGTFEIDVVEGSARILCDGADVTSNYDIACVSGNLSVMAGTPPFTPPQARELVYDGTGQELVIPGEVESDGYTFEYSSSQTGPFVAEIPTATEAGEYGVYYRIVDAEGSPAASIGPQRVAVSIGRRSVTIVPEGGQGKTYGDGDPALGYVAEGWDESMAALVGSLAREEGEGAGSYAITQGSLADDANPNYRISFAGGESFTIRRRVVTVTGVVAADKVYDGTAAVDLSWDGWSLENVLEGDREKLFFEGCEGSFDEPAAGEGKRVSLTGITLSGDALPNYTVRDDQYVTASIAKRPGKVTASYQVVLWGDEIEAGVEKAALSGLPEVTESGAAPGESLTGITLKPQGPVTESGVITPSDAVITNALGEGTTENYDLSYEDGQLVVMNVLPDYTPPTAREGLAYDGTELELVVPGEITGEPSNFVIAYALSKDGEYTESVPTAKAAGTYEVWWKIVDASDHSKQAGSIPTQSLSVTVAPREAQLAWSGTECWYDGREHVPSATVSNLAPGDACTVTVTGAQTEVGTYTATATKLTDENYRLPASTTTQFVIKLAEVVIPSEVILGPGAPVLESSNLGDVAQLLVSDEERGLAAEGVDVRIWVQVDRISEADLSTQERAAFTGRLKELGATAGWYLDIRVFKRVGDEVTQIEKTANPLLLAVTVPEELRSSGRTHFFIRGHSFEATVLATTQGDVLEGESDLFSPYLLAYRDEPTPVPPTPVPPSPTPPAVLPKTGDPSLAAAGLVVVALAALALGLTLRME